MFEEEEEPLILTPVNFFQIQADCTYIEPGMFPSLSQRNSQKYLLPNTSAICSEEHFADVAMGWNHEGIEFLVTAKVPYIQASYPNMTSGDSVELFLDTRDVKTSGFNTRFCHHFFFLPEAVESQVAGEITRFRTEDVHELCNPKDLNVKAVLKNNGYAMHILIPIQCLFGYDPEQFSRVGFTYRINRASGLPQHFSVISDEYQVEQQPSLWSSIQLIK